MNYEELDYDNIDYDTFDFDSYYAQMEKLVTSCGATYYYERRNVDKDNDFYDPSKQGVITWREQN